MGGPINVDWDYNQDSAETVPALLMQAPIGPQSDARGMYEMEKVAETHLHVWPVKVRNGNGSLIDYQAPLSRQMTLAIEAGSAVSALEQLCSHLSRGGQEPIGLAPLPSYPLDRLTQHKVADIRTENETARQRLAEVLWMVDGTLSWQ